MIAIQEEDGRLWWCPYVNIYEAYATVTYWRRLGIECEVTIVPDDWPIREIREDNE